MTLQSVSALRRSGLLTLPLASLFLLGCPSSTVRKSGQVELFVVHPEKQALIRPQSVRSQQQLSEIAPGRSGFTPRFGDRVRLNSDVLCINVHSAYIDSLPSTLTGSHDVILFADVWEDGADAYDAPALTTVVYVGKNQMVPGRLNFDGNIAYGPTNFKGRPLRIRFTLMLLQKEKGEQLGGVADVVQNVSKAIPTYGVFVSQAAAVMRDVLKAQPDIICFDYEATLMSDQPEGLSTTLLASGGKSGSDTVADATKTALARAADAVSLMGSNRTLLASGIGGTNMDFQPERVTQIAMNSGSMDRSQATNFAKAFLDTKVAETQASLRAVEANPKVRPETRRKATQLRTSLVDSTQSTNVTDRMVAEVLDADRFGFSDRYGWLHYGFYALVETAARTRRSTEATTIQGGKGGPAPAPADDAVKGRRFDADSPYVYEGGWIYSAKGQQPGSADRVRNKYLVFSVTPGQIQEENSTLAAASRANATLLQSLRQSSGSLQSVREGLDKSVGLLKETVLKSRLRDTARQYIRSNNLQSKSAYQGKESEIRTELTSRLTGWIHEVYGAGNVVPDNLSSNLVQGAMDDLSRSFDSLDSR